ncbi:MAG: amidohydrolase family protein, partial [Terracoccus sp.]
LEAGLDVCTHAIGDQANRLVLDAFAVMRDEGQTGILRIEHAQHLRPHDVARFRALQVIASVQPSHCTSDLEMVDHLLGERPVLSYAFRTLLDAGVRLAFGSDAPVEEPNPFHGVHAAVTRQREGGVPPGGWHPDEQLTLDEAMHAHTVGAHEAVGRTDVGRLVPGQLADLVCLDRDLWSVDPADLRDTQVLQTMIGGEVVFSR